MQGKRGGGDGRPCSRIGPSPKWPAHGGWRSALTKEVELGAPDEPRGRATRAGSVAHAAYDRGRDRAVLLHDEPGGRGDLVGEGHHGVMQRAAREIRAPA